MSTKKQAIERRTARSRRTNTAHADKYAAKRPQSFGHHRSFEDAVDTLADRLNARGGANGD